MKKIISILLILAALLSFAACNNEPAVTTPSGNEETPSASTPEETPSATPSATPSETPAETDPPAPPARPDVDIVIAEGTEQKTYIVIPAKDRYTALYAKDKLTLIVERRLGFKMKYGTDETEGTEILIGDTGREESAALSATLSGNQYGIRIGGGKVVIAATDGAFLYDAMAYFVENYLTITDTKIEVNTQNASYVGEGDTESLRYVLTHAEDKKAKFKKDGSFSVMTPAPSDKITASQGGCTDGTYIYQGFIEIIHSTSGTRDEKYNNCVIVKQDLEGNVIKVGPVIGGFGSPDSLNHTNDMAYNPNTHEIYVVHNRPNFNKVSIIDPDTLELKRSVFLPHPVYSISYCPERDVALVGLSNSQNVRPIGTEFKAFAGASINATTLSKGYTTQGITSDDTFIYCLLISTGNKNVITVYDWYGNYICMIDTGVTMVASTYMYEGENIKIIDGQLYMTTAFSKAGCQTYRLVPKN